MLEEVMYLSYNCESSKNYISEILTTPAFWEGLYNLGLYNFEIIVKIPDPMLLILNTEIMTSMYYKSNECVTVTVSVK